MEKSVVGFKKYVENTFQKFNSYLANGLLVENK